MRLEDVALMYCLSAAGVDSVLCGMREPSVIELPTERGPGFGLGLLPADRHV